MIYAHLTVLYILLDEDELLCWTGTHSPEKSIFVYFWCSILCLLQMYFSMLLLFSTWWSLLYHAQYGPEGVLKQVPLLADCHSCEIQLPLYRLLTNDSALVFYDRCHFPISARCWWCYLNTRINPLPLSFCHHHTVYTILSAFLVTSERQVHQFTYRAGI